jgi:hypothetical protein
MTPPTPDDLDAPWAVLLWANGYPAPLPPPEVLLRGHWCPAPPPAAGRAVTAAAVSRLLARFRLRPRRPRPGRREPLTPGEAA